MAWVKVPPAHHPIFLAALRKWIAKAFEGASALPPTKKKAKPKKAAAKKKR